MKNSMKRSLYIFAAVIAAMACAKETPNKQSTLPPKDEAENVEEVKEKDAPLHELFVAIGDVTDADAPAAQASVSTKAAVSDVDGAFTWSEGDKVLVTTSTSDTYEFIAQEDGKSARFTYSGDMNGTPTTVTYPSDGTIALPTSITSLTGALSGDYLRMTGTVTENAATLSHRNALLKVTFTNVPDFASKVVFEGKNSEDSATNTVTVSGISISEGTKGEVTAYLPVDPTTTQFTIMLEDSNSNVILQKSTSGKSFTAGTLKKMKALAVGPVIRIKDETSWGTKAVYIWNTSNTSKNGFFATGYDYPYRFNTLAADDHYIIMGSELASNLNWTAATKIGIKFQTNDNAHSTETPGVYLMRDVTFNVPSELGMKTEYRIYPHGTTTATHALATYGTGTYDTPENITVNVSQSGTQWSTLKWYANNGEVISGAWPGTTFSPSSSFTMPANKVYGKTVTLVIDNGGDGGDWKNYNQTKDLIIDCTSSPNNHISSISVELSASWDSQNDNKRFITWTSSTFADEILGYPLGTYPGTAFTCTSSISPSHYISFNVDDYGRTVSINFNNNGGGTSINWDDITINQDFDYGF